MTNYKNIIKMNYLILHADYMSSGIRHEYGDQIPKYDNILSVKTWESIISWVNSYSPVVMMDELERKLSIDLINELDQEGLKIKNEIESQLNAKVKYYSEGFLKYI